MEPPLQFRPQPVFRFEKPNAERDGAVFVGFEDWDPELLMLIEVRGRKTVPAGTRGLRGSRISRCRRDTRTSKSGVSRRVPRKAPWGASTSVSTLCPASTCRRLPAGLNRAFARAQVSFRLHAQFEVATLVDFDPDGAAASPVPASVRRTDARNDTAQFQRHL